MKRDTGETAEAFRRRVDDYMRRAEAGLSDAKRQARSAWSSGTDAAGRTASQINAQARHGQERLADLYDSQPLIMGAVGIAAGAFLAALLPATRAEDEALGETGAQLRGKALHETEKVRDRSTESAREVVSAAADQGTTETEKSARAVEEATEEKSTAHDQSRDRATD